MEVREILRQIRAGESDRAIGRNLKINRAYLLKEAFRSLWDYHYPAWAESYLDQWIWWATHSRLEPMRDFAWMVKRHGSSP